MGPLAVLALLVLAYVVATAVRSAPAASVTPLPRTVRVGGRPTTLSWPAGGESAAAIEGAGTIGTRGPAKPTPIASLAKVMTAYLVLHDHPLRPSAGGPQIGVTRADVAAFRADRAGGQSVVAVRAGERLTERQALQGLLLPSGNNLAAVLARWDAGSERGFVRRMNATARDLGLRHTRYTDPSGLAPGTVSTAGDQVALALRAMALPVFRQTVGMTQATLPIAGRVFNLDGLLGHDGIIGIKTGTTAQAGGCFVFAARARAGHRRVTIVGAVLHQMASASQPSILAAAFAATRQVLGATRRSLGSRRVLRIGTTLAWASVPWSARVPLRAARSVSLLAWPGMRAHVSVAATSRITAPVRAGATVGEAVVTAGSERRTVPLVAGGSLPSPSFTWRLKHP